MNRHPTEAQMAAFYKAYDDSLECQPREHHQAMYEGLSAALAVEAGTVGVKPLVFDRTSVDGSMVIADSVFGEYWAWEINGTGVWSRGSLPGVLCQGGISEAKAAAQADYQARILSALTTSPASSAVEGEAVADYPYMTENVATSSAFIGSPAPTPAGDGLLKAAQALKRIVEEIDGTMNHGTWRDELGMRLKDTREWVDLYLAISAASPAPQTEDLA